eukprot:364398-Chlamydomonas_euryale.AAC.23
MLRGVRAASDAAVLSGASSSSPSLSDSRQPAGSRTPRWLAARFSKLLGGGMRVAAAVPIPYVASIALSRVSRSIS